MRATAQIKEVADAQIPSSDYIPMGTHVAPNVIKLKRNGDYMATWRLEGISFETSDPTEIAIRKEGLNNFLKALGGGHFAVWTHKVRRVVRERLGGTFENDFCRDFNERYYKSFDNHRQMATELYLTVIYRPTTSRAGNFLKRMAVRSISQIREKEQEDLDTLDDMAKQVESSLKRYEPERLGSFKKDGKVYSEMLGFLGFLVNGVWEDIPMQRADIGEYLPTSRLHFGDKNGMLQIWHPNAQKFVGFLDFQDYPKLSEPGMNNGILYGDYEYIESQSFSIKNKRDAMDGLERQQGQLRASEDAGTDDVEQLTQALKDVKSGEYDMGEYHYTLAIFGQSLGEVAKNMSSARTILQDDAGFKLSVIDAIPECAWFAQLPGNWTMRPREAQITSRNFAALSPLHNFARGKRNGNPWGEALALLKTPSGQPFYLNFHVSPEDKDSVDEKYAGNTFICGTTGSGKTTLQMGLIMFATKYYGLRVVAFDKDRGMEIGIRAMGGKYFALKRGEPTGFNPFQFDLTEENISFCERLVKQLLKGDDEVGLTAREQIVVSNAVRTVMSDQVTHRVRSLSAVYQVLTGTGDNSLRDRLQKWTRGQPLGWVFDNEIDNQDFTTAKIFGYDYTDFLDDPEVRTPIMAYLLHITETLINGQPLIYIMEEFWKPLMDEMFSDFALNKQKTIRKQSGLGVFVTQSPSDVLTHRIGKTMVEQSVTQIYLPNPRADRKDYVEGFKVTEAEFDIIKNLGETSRMFLVKQGHRSAIVQYDLGGMDDILNVISGTSENVELLDDIREKVGDDPQDWLPLFHRRVSERRALAKS
ncbi:VirB4 family type IV secretion/conjugal transfer ATPase [Variovorax guangxiensis]|uniref:Type IV secretion system protein virB4 n=1 Tax=Variovorax guangxiensis TaxID=1775474 RepID=A0A3S0XXD6_9BURK|nr:VirB4 family type IV secretion/conjugal transfer ATPase [Variovorax guangxiensis]RUR71894.1 VirB4 family type IV secretion/conjugal transfer ATPase [Variovorax guangxiensis]